MFKNTLSVLISKSFQMVWAKSSEIGCAAYRCASLNLPTHYALKSWFFICHYSPKFVLFVLYMFWSMKLLDI